MITALLLDFDGTIVDSETAEAEAWAVVYAEHGHELDRGAVARGAGHIETQGAPGRRLAALLGDDTLTETLMAQWYAQFVECVVAEEIRPGILAWLEEARAMGWRTAVASSSSRDWVVPHLDRLGLLADLDTVVCGDEVERTKPAPDVYLLALRRLGVDAGTAIAVEDSVHGATAAEVAGCHVVVTPNPMTLQQDWPAHFDHVDLATLTLRDLAARLERA